MPRAFPARAHQHTQHLTSPALETGNQPAATLDHSGHPNTFLFQFFRGENGKIPIFISASPAPDLRPRMSLNDPFLLVFSLTVAQKTLQLYGRYLSARGAQPGGASCLSVKILKKCWPWSLGLSGPDRRDLTLPETGALITAEKTRD